VKSTALLCYDGASTFAENLLNPSSPLPSPPRHSNSETIRFRGFRDRSYWKRLLPPASVFLLVLLYHWPILSGLYSFMDVGPDIAVMSLPDLDLRAYALRHGVVPIWDLYENGGVPMLALVTPAILDPFTYLLLLAPLKNGHIGLGYVQAYYALLHCFAALAAYALLKELKLRSPLAAVAASVFYAIAGIAGNASWIQFVTETIYGPLVLLFLFRSLRGLRPLANAALAGALLGLCWFSGTHHIPLVTGLSCCAMLFAFTFLGSRRLGILRFLVFAATMICVSAPQILPALQYGRLSVRWVGLVQPVAGAGKVPFQAHLLEALHPSALLNILFQVGDTFWGSKLVFMGLVAVAFAIVAASRFRTSRLVRLCLALAAGGLLMSMAAHNVFYGLAYLFIPAFDKLREAAVWMYAAQLASVCLVGVGLDTFLAREEVPLGTRIAKVLAVLGAVLLVVTYWSRIFPNPQHEPQSDWIAMSGLLALLLAGVIHLFERGMLSPFLAGTFVLVLVMLEHGDVSNVAGYHFVPRRGAGFVSPYVDPLRQTQPLADFLHTRSDLTRVDVNPQDIPANFGDYHRIETMSIHGASLLTPVSEMNYRSAQTRLLYGVNYYLARQPSEPDQVALFTAPSGIKVFSNPGARPRVWSVHQVSRVNDFQHAHRLLHSSSFDTATTSFLNVSPPSFEECPAEDHIQLLHRSWFSVTIRANMACKGMVVLNDNWYPEWHASLDGKRTTLYAAYTCIRGVAVPAGSHIIQMQYQPRNLYLGLLLFGIGTATVVWLFRRYEPPAPDLLMPELKS
jgi:hypothetical protein